MKDKKITSLAILPVFAMFYLVLENCCLAQESFVISGKTSHIQIDGDDVDWTEVEELRATVLSNDINDLPPEMRVKWVWDNYFLYILVNVVPSGSNSLTEMSLNILLDVEDARYRWWAPFDELDSFQFVGMDQVNSPRVFSVAKIVENRLIYEIAISMKDVGEPVFYGYDYVIENDSQIDVRLEYGSGNGEHVVALHSSDSPAVEPTNLRMIEFVDPPEFPDAIVANIDEVLLDNNGGVMDVALTSFFESVDFQLFTIEPWIKSTKIPGGISVELNPNLSDNRIGELFLGDFGSIKVSQFGETGSPWFNLGDGIKESEWFGSLVDASFPWVLSEDWGWLWVEGNRPESVYFYDWRSAFWFWTREGVYPYLYAYRKDGARWYFVQRRGNYNERWVWDYKDLRWVYLDKSG